MTYPQMLGFILICLMIGIVFLTTRYVSSARYKGKGVYHIIINAWFRNNQCYRAWLRVNRDYQWCMILVPCLCAAILLLIEPFRENRMFIRPEESLYINLALWVAIFFTYKWLFKKINKVQQR
jgi:hypothetical protein